MVVSFVLALGYQGNSRRRDEMSEIERIVKRRKQAHSRLLALKSPVYEAFLSCGGSEL